MTNELPSSESMSRALADVEGQRDKAHGSIRSLREETERLRRERDAIALMWFRELADTLKGEERLYGIVGPDIYTGVDDETAIEAARKAAGLEGEPS